jgi:hypothetical protein
MTDIIVSADRSNLERGSNVVRKRAKFFEPQRARTLKRAGHETSPFAFWLWLPAGGCGRHLDGLCFRNQDLVAATGEHFEIADCRLT